MGEGSRRWQGREALVGGIEAPDQLKQEGRGVGGWGVCGMCSLFLSKFHQKRVCHQFE